MTDFLSNHAAALRQRERFKSFSFLAVALATTLLATGCGQKGVSGSAVSGQVTINDGPLPSGEIMFMPQKSAPGLRTVAAQISEGKYSIAPEKLLVPGAYRVLVTAQKKTGRKVALGGGMIDEVVDYIPPEYNVETTLTADIKGDTPDLSFQLQVSP